MSQAHIFSLETFLPRVARMREAHPLTFPANDVWVRSHDWADWKMRDAECLDHKPIRKFSVAIVGTRKPSEYGVRVVEELVRRLSLYDVCIVSGGAFKINHIAHEAALSWGLSTRAWLVGPIEDPGPRHHRQMFEAIERSPGSALIVPGHLESETGARKYLGGRAWLTRNSWVVGDADALVIVEAFQKSGTWQTAKDSSILGIPCFGVPGPVFSGSSQGINRMISEGYASPVWDLGELTESLVVLGAQASYNIYRGSQERGQDRGNSV